ncbi:LOW QUALITY PROTEIN: hypothetical protein TorRG33x02_355220 [Trema orientale]|uniref:GAG-pre-integrase domain-containing protein n=1 Tax=Trema orientale TaxID=63057 RepID=A0A2P5A9N6_TREOI|nr:LOW QUALITY PROTEIN: hypothetical protein TorRG33x02_355220 [Trema orientale]
MEELSYLEITKLVRLGELNPSSMFDGCIRVRHNVRYVLELRRNLILLGMLDSIGCSVKIENGVIKVVKGALTVMKGNLSNGLYSLIGETIARSASVVTDSQNVVTGSQNVVTSKTILINGKNVMTDSRNVLTDRNLWHKRLRHISERGLDELY